MTALLQQRPALLRELLVALGRPVFSDALRVVDSSVRVANPIEVRPDVLLADPANRDPWVMIEVQMQPDPDKRRRWLSAAGALVASRGVEGDLVVLTTQPRVAKWAESIAHTGGPLGSRFLLIPSVILLQESMLDALLTGTQPELAVFAIWAVAHRKDAKARLVLRRCLGLIEEVADALLRRVLVQAMVSMLGDAMAAVLRRWMMNPEAIPETPKARELRLLYEAFVERMEARGEARGEARALRVFLESRGFLLTDSVRSRILACSDPAVLARWIGRAASATELSDVFTDE
ncbi:MAG: hypothetical protein Q8Q09_10110 [Deltaproteobacteria bacterium]|nr:hypothetical protein [Deltaproteobacteria bacterium]